MNQEEIAARIAASNAKKPAREKINNTELVRQTGLKIVHCRSNYLTREATVAFRQNHNIIEIATAVCHKGDAFTKKIGTRLAINNHKAGKTVLIPLQHGTNAVHTIQAMFGVFE